MKPSGLQVTCNTHSKTSVHALLTAPEDYRNAWQALVQEKFTSRFEFCICFYLS